MKVTDISTTTNATDILDSIMPSFGKSRVNTPIYDMSRMGFILNDHETVGHNRAHSLVRIHNNIVIVEQLGTYHSHNYTNSLSVYTFNGYDLQLISLKNDYDKEHYDMSRVRCDTEEIVFNFLKSQMVTLCLPCSDEGIKAKAIDTVGKCYRNILDDESFKVFDRLPELLKQVDNNVKLLTIK